MPAVAVDEVNGSGPSEIRAGLDFDSDPLSYPGSPTFESQLVFPEIDHEHALQFPPRRRIGQARSARCGRCPDPDPGGSWTLNYELLRRNVANVDDRFPVVAVGSNADPAVMRGKLERAGVVGVVPFVRASITNLGIGHSAHIGRPGFIPAAPYHVPQGESVVVAGWLDKEQLIYLDITEPNYTRVLLSGDDYPLELQSGERLGRFFVYQSKWGVLKDEKGVLPFGDQHVVAEWLRDAGLPPWEAAEAEVAVRFLAKSPTMRVDARNALKLNGHTRDSELKCVRSDRPETYGRIDSEWQDFTFGPALLRCVATRSTLQRNGQQCVVLNPDDVPTSVTGIVLVAPGIDVERPGAPARLIREKEQPRGTIGVDQVLRNALGVERGEPVSAGPAIGHENPLADFLFARPHYVMCRVQSADLSSVEQNVALLSPMALRLLGVPGGARVIVEGCTDPAHSLQAVRLTALEASEEALDRRTELSGGSLSARFPSSRDALGVFPDLPWIFLDAAERSALGLNEQKLAAVRVRASRRDQMIVEVRELVLLFILAAVGLAALIESPLLVGGLLCALVLAGLLLARARLRRRLEVSATLTRLITKSGSRRGRGQ